MDSNKTKQQLIAELARLRQKVEQLKTDAAAQRADVSPRPGDPSKHKLDQLTALSQASQAVTSSLELEQVLAKIASPASEVVATDYTSVVLVDGDGQLGKGAENIPGVPALEYRVRQSGVTQWIVQSRRPVIVDHIDEDGTIHPPIGDGGPRFANPPIVEARVKSLAGLPLMMKGEFLGVLYLHSLRPNAFRDHVPLLTAFANQVAIAIENARLYEAAQREVVERAQAEEALRKSKQRLQQYAKRLQIIHDIDRTILSAWSAKEIAQASLRHIQDLIPCEWGDILTYDHDAQQVTLLAAYPLEKSPVPLGTQFSLTGIDEISLLRRGEILRVDDFSAYLSKYAHEEPMPPTLERLSALGVHAFVAVPLISQDELIGIMTLLPGAPEAIACEHIDIAQELANQIAVVLHQATLRTALETEQKRLKTLVNHLPEGVLLLDGERRILQINPAATNYLKILTTAENTPDIGDILTHLADWSTENLTAGTWQEIWQEIETESPNHCVFSIVARPILTTADPEGWVILLWDVTHEREMERQNRQQERLAAVGQLAGGIAHDFNNYLTTILLYGQMLLRDPNLSATLAPNIETIIGESRRATRLVQQILDFSRRGMMETKPIDLIAFIEETIAILHRTFPENIALTIEIATEQCVANADPTRIQQILMNLAVNARDAMPEGGKLTIGVSCIEFSPRNKPPVNGMPPGKWIHLSVIDTGVGIPPDVLPYIYEPFFTTKPVGKGTGLGLSQVYGIVKQHGGYIDVETAVDHGTTFHVYLPAYEMGQGAQDATEDAAPLGGNGETILLVEDEIKLRKICKQALESLDYHVLTAAHGVEALRIYQSASSIDLVLTDLVMPQMGGKALIEALKMIDPDVKIIATTGYALPDDVETLLDEDDVAVMMKPIEINKLAETVRRVLDAA